MTELKLFSSTNGYWSEYNSSIDATISNNFATSSFRFAHTLIPVKTNKSDCDAIGTYFGRYCNPICLIACDETLGQRYFKPRIR